MNKRLLSLPILLVTGLLIGGFLRNVDGQGQSFWRHDFAKAEAEARSKGIPLLVHIYGNGCPPCEMMERNVLNTAEVRRMLEGRVVPVKVNGNYNPSVLERFNVNSWPRDIVVLPDGKVLWHNTGGMAKNQYLSSLSSVHTKWNEIREAESKKINVQIAKGKSSYLEETENETDAENGKKKTVGLRGYSPVSLTLHRKWVKGTPEYETNYKGIVYRFASSEEREQFLETPRYFAPQLLGCDPVVMYHTDRAIPGDTRFCTFFDERLYIFVSEESREEFKKDEMKYTRQRHVLLEMLSLDQVERY